MKSMWITSKKYLGALQNDLKSLENILLLILLKVNQIVTFGVQQRLFYTKGLGTDLEDALFSKRTGSSLSQMVRSLE